MNKGNYKFAALETLAVLKNMDENYLRKVPQNFLNYLRKIALKNVNLKLDLRKEIKDLNLSKEAKEILGYIYIKFWSTNEEKLVCEKLLKLRKNN